MTDKATDLLEELKNKNKKWYLFVLEYIKDFNGARAAKEAGYTAKFAARRAFELLEKPEINAALQQAMEERSERTKIDADWVLTEAVDLYKECRQEGDRKSASTVLKTIGTHVDVQAFKEKHELTGPNDGPIEIVERKIVRPKT